MRLPPGTGFSVRGLTSAGFITLALLCVGAAAGLGWLAGVLQDTGTRLARDAQTVDIATQLELRLLNYVRLAVFMSDPNVRGDPLVREEQRLAQQELRETLQAAAEIPVSVADRSLVERAVASVNAYVERRSEIDDGDAPSDVQTLLNDALGHVRLLRQTSRSEAEAAYERAQRVGTFFINTALAAALLAALLLLVMTIAVGRVLIRPILALRETIERYRAGDHRARADERAPRELREIARAFNDMSDELGRQRATELAFIAGVAHDLRNPLSAVRYSVEALRALRADWDAESLRLLEMLGRQLDHLARMVNDLLETASIEAGQLALSRRVFDLRASVAAVLELYAPATADRTLQVALGDEPAPIDADQTRIEQAVGNLLNNAIKYTSPRDSIEIRVSVGESTVELTVADGGVGISGEDLQNMFVPFWRGARSSTHRGSGLGLSVVRRIALAHGGDIRVESVPGQGSVFRLTLPKAAPAVPAAAVRDASAS